MVTAASPGACIGTLSVNFPLHFIRSIFFGLFFVICFPHPNAFAQLRYEIPLVMRAGLPVIEARLPDVDVLLKFVFDTGADVNVIDTQVVKRLKLSNSIVGKIIVNETIKEDIVRLTNIKFANMTIPALDAASVNFNLPTTAPDNYLDGILGQDILREFDVTIDVPAQILILEKTNSNDNRFESAHCFANAISWRQSLEELHATYVDILLPHKYQDGQFVRVHALVDTGATITVLNWSAARAIGLTPEDTSLVKSKRGVTGLDPNSSTETYFYEMPTLKLGPLQVAPLKVAISDAGGFALHGMKGRPGAILGMDVLKQQRLTISKESRRFCFGANIMEAGS